ncbi:NAD-dependent epimerase/dehydratase family protein [Bordetella sp. LUAb4]|uniref:NAD-dependent epimerase/dehydratase family protein n=1 Tax=Bordetella sp. LUAb4 TaxID=2843195 RepID=UPI001E5FB0A9|nr:NAD-dependent epimerase/dehydratase family protein [Bordetella sp. LUAb4]
MNTYLVTGGAGFIGSHLADDLIAAGHEVRILDNFSTGKQHNIHVNARVIRGDVNDYSVLLEASRGCDGIFHLAAIASVARSTEDWPGTHRTNQGATVSVLDCARAHGRLPVVYASSAAVYGDCSTLPLTENSDTDPISAYGADKLGGELHARVGTLIHQIPTIAFRFFNVYGPRQDPKSPYSGVISIFAEQLLNGRNVLIHGDGRQTRDFIYVKDVVDHLTAGMKAMHDRAFPVPQIFNVCSGVSTSIKQLADTIAEITKRPASLHFGPPREGDIRSSLGSRSKTEKLLNVAPPTSLYRGLQALVDSMA